MRGFALPRCGCLKLVPLATCRVLIAGGVGVLLSGWFQVASAQGVDAGPAVPELQAYLDRLQSEHGDLFGVGPAAGRLAGEVRQRVTDALLEDAGAEDQQVRDTAVGRGLLLVAQLYGQAGEAAKAQETLRQASRQGTAETQAVALYRLGEHHFLRRRYLPKDERGVSASYYWKELATRFPQSRWTQVTARPLRYLRYLSGEETLRFEGVFRVEASETETTYSDKSLAGKLVIVNFWSSSLPGQKEFEEGLAKDMRSSLEQYPVLKGQIELLSVNLDTDGEAYRNAVREWQIPWPQAHDGRGFAGALAEQFAVPRLPHWCVIGPDGSLLYLGGRKEVFYAEATKAMKSLRIALEERQ